MDQSENITLNITPEMSRELIERTAIHEAGHVVMAYYFGYRCKYSDCSNERPGEGTTATSYGEDQQLINMLQHYTSFRHELNLLISQDKERAKAFFSRLVLILSAGTAAEITSDNETDKIPPDQLNAADGECIGTFMDGLNEFGLNILESEVIIGMSASIGLFKDLVLWSTVKGVAELILSKANLHVDQQEIEAYLKSVDFKPV